MILVDTNVLLDVVQDDPQWGDWSPARLEAHSLAGPPVSSAVIYSELSVAFEWIEKLAVVIAEAAVQGDHILTRDTGRYRRYYPTVRLVSPGDHEP